MADGQTAASFPQVKTSETDGYNAVQVGYQKVIDSKLNKPEMGHIKKAGVAPMKHLQEFRVSVGSARKTAGRALCDRSRPSNRSHARPAPRSWCLLTTSRLASSLWRRRSSRCGSCRPPHACLRRF